MICDLSGIGDIIKREKLHVLVVSYGGSCSNALVQVLTRNGYKCSPPIWHKILCHCPHYIDVDIPIIYIYDNPIKAFISMKNRGRGYWDTNQRKLSNNEKVGLSDDNLLKLMISQFNSWTSVKRDNVLVLKTGELFEQGITKKLETFLCAKKIRYFPIPYKEPKTSTEKITNNQWAPLFKKYKPQLDYIASFQ